MPVGGKKELGRDMYEFERVDIGDIRDLLVVAGGIRVVGKKFGDVIFSLRLKSDGEDEYSSYWMFCGRWGKIAEGGKERILWVFGVANRETCWFMDVPIFECDPMISEAFKAGMRLVGVFVTFYTPNLAFFSDA